MHLILRTLILFSLALAMPAQAQWSYHAQTAPKIQNSALQLAQQINKIPEPLFMSDNDKQQVDKLLSRVLDEQSQQINNFQQQLTIYRNKNNDRTWLKTQSDYLTLHSLSQSKEQLLALADTSISNDLTGFGPDGVIQFKQEWLQTRLNAQYLLIYQTRAFKSLIQDLFISPVPVIWALFKVLCLYFIVGWWLKNSQRIIELFRKTKLESTQSPSVWVRVVWYISRAHRAIAFLIAITVSLNILSQIPSLQHLIFLEIFTWWILGGSIAISFILEFTYRNSRSSNKEIIGYRLSTVRRYIWSFIIAGVILQISMRTLGKATIYSWIYSALFFWFILVTVSVLRLWRAKVFEIVERLTDKPIWVDWAVYHKNKWLLNIVGTAITAAWLSVYSFKLRTISILSQYTMFSQALAYLFRIEVAKQTSNSNQQQQLNRIRGNQAFDYVLPGAPDSTLIDYGANEIKQLSKYLLTDSPAICVVSGERGVGTTTLLNTILNKVNNATPIYLNCPYSGYAELLSNFATSLNLDKESSEIQIIAHLRKSETTYLIAVDNTQRLVKPMVRGLDSLIRLTNLLRRSKKNHRVVMAIEKSSWRFVDRARGERLLFDWVTFLPSWTEKQVASLLNSRINHDIETPLSFDGLRVPKQWDQDEISEEERAKLGFYRILWHYSDGNPTVALRFFRLSLNRIKETNQVVVRLFHAPQSEELEKMPKPMLAILRSIVQLEIASPEELSECTQLSIAEVIGTLRYFESRGFIEWNEDKAKVCDHWFRHITNVLDRQHLLVK